ncbi:MAG: cytochrome c biogenesis protein CcdA, partial [Nitrospinota bacterium]
VYPETVVELGALLLIYSAGLAVPFLLAAVAFNGFLGFFNRFKRFIPAVQKVGGGVLVLMGFLLLTGRLTILNTYAISLTPEWLLKWL